MTVNVGFSPESAARITRVVQTVERSPSDLTIGSSPVSAGIETQWIQLTSTTPAETINGAAHYPAVWYLRTANATWHPQNETVYAVSINNQTPATDRKYLGRRLGYAGTPSRMVYGITVENGSGNGSINNVTIEGVLDGVLDGYPYRSTVPPPETDLDPYNRTIVNGTVFHADGSNTSIWGLPVESFQPWFKNAGFNAGLTSNQPVYEFRIPPIMKSWSSGTDVSAHLLVRYTRDYDLYTTLISNATYSADGMVFTLNANDSFPATWQNESLFDGISFAIAGHDLFYVPDLSTKKMYRAFPWWLVGAFVVKVTDGDDAGTHWLATYNAIATGAQCYRGLFRLPEMA